ncbi:DUF2809 domain-containing protein [Oceanobacter mangrovi]|uniref:ribosomal maturation YjgA family protein n=1 Tax=Oceanobacter mangrovi TaxID=2862510 RepID=UPI001C8DE992|nr:DUF2809 domain-containing protein [Oceanobacter mangrovi]
MRHILIYSIACITTIMLGLSSRSPNLDLPLFVHLYVGDFLWAMMVYFGFCLITPKWRFRNQISAALLFSYGIEFSQFYHADWIDSIRATTIGGLVLGFGFRLSDLVAYTLGVGTGAAINRYLLKKPGNSYHQQSS